MALKRHITTTGLLFTSLSLMVGSGWLFGAYFAASIAGPAALISWILGGLLIALVALCYSELAAMLPLSGGISRYTQLGYGTLVSFCMSWLAWLSCVAVAPTEVQAILQYGSHLWPWLTYQEAGVNLLTWPGFGVACVLLFGISALNVMGVKKVTGANSAITYWKIGIPLLVIFVLIYTSFDAQNFTQHGGFAPAGWHGILWALPAAGVIFSFLGAPEATMMAGEVKNPQRAIPIAILGSVGICILLYALIQVAFVGSLSTDMLSHGWTGLHFTGDTGPFAGIATALGLTWLAALIYFDAILSPAGTALIYTAATARLNYAMGKNRFFPSWMFKLNARGVPAIAVLVNFLVGILMLFPFPSWQSLIEFQSVAIVLAYGVGPICLIAFRKQLPDTARPFKLPIKHVLCLLTFYVCNLMAYWTGWETIWRLEIATLIGLLFLIAYRTLRKHNESPLHLSHASWLIAYFGGLGIVSYFGNFNGGQNILTFGWDFLAVAAFTLIVYVLALRCMRPATEVQGNLAYEVELDHEYTLEEA